MSLAVWLCHLLLCYHLLLCCITCHSCEAITLAGPKPAKEKWLARLASGLKFSLQVLRDFPDGGCLDQQEISWTPITPALDAQIGQGEE